MAVDMDPITTGNSDVRAAEQVPGRDKPAGPALGLVDSLHVPWWKSFAEEVGSVFRPQEKLPPPPKYRDPLPGERTLDFGANAVQGSWFQNIAEYFRLSEEEKKLPKFEGTSQPVAVMCWRSC